MMEVYLSRRAELDIAKIALRIAEEANEDVAWKWEERLMEAVEALGDNPHAWFRRPKLGEGVFVRPFDSYNIWFEVAADGVDVIRILSAHIGNPAAHLY